MNINTNGISPFASIVLPPGSTSNDLQAAVNSATSGDIIEISSNMSFVTAVAVPADMELTIRSDMGNHWILTQTAMTTRHFSVTGSLILQDITLDGGNIGGGAAINSGGSLTLNTGAIIHNCLGINGGGAQVYNGGTLLLSGGEFSQNHADNGGGIHAAAASVVNILSGTVLGNTADSNGGGIYGYFVQIDNADINGNTAGINGGGIYGSTGCNFTVNGGSVSFNVANGSGGGIYANSSSGSRSTVTLDNAQITGNTANVNGGGVFGYSYCTITTVNSTIEGNSSNGSGSAASGGGGIYGFSFSAISIVGGRISNNICAANGGGIFGYANSRITVINGAMIGGDSDPEGNRAMNGGGICSYGLPAGMSYATVSGSAIRNNFAYELGGGLACISDSADLVNINVTIENNTEFSNNRAVEGGGVYASHETILIVRDSYFRFNSADRGGGLHYFSPGAPSPAEINNGEFEGNIAFDRGGGIYAGGSYEIFLRGINFFDNQADYLGGGICLAGGNLSGGVQSAGTVFVEGCMLYDNVARNGGGIGAINETISGIISYCDVLLRSGTQLFNNMAHENGGGVYGAAYAQSNATARTMIDVENGVRLTNNQAQNGGGIYATSINTSNGNSGCYVIMQGSVEENSAYENGGGIYGRAYAGGFGMSQCSLDIEAGGFIVNNGAGMFGGGVYISKDGYYSAMCAVNVRDGVIGSNAAESGGGIYCGHSTEAYISNSAIEFNGNPVFVDGSMFGPVRDGGGIYLTGTAWLHVGGMSVIRDNAAPNGAGGGIFTEEISYQNFITEPPTLFMGNMSSIANAPPPNAYSLYPNIGFSSVSIFDHPLNNYDINFDGFAGFFTVTYDSNGGFGYYTDFDLPYGFIYRILDPGEIGITRPGHRLTMWNTDPNGFGVPYFPGEMVEIVEDIILYAQWEPDEFFTISYDPNGGIGGHVDFGIPYGSEYMIQYPDQIGIYRPGHSFLYWTTDPGGGGDYYYPGELIEVTSDLTLFAQWEISEFFTVTYDPNGGVGGHADYGIPYGTDYILLSPDDFGMFRPGYRFIAWSNEPDVNGGGTLYLPGQIIQITEDLTLYAQWEVSDFFSVSYEPNGGVGGYIDFGIPYETLYAILSPEQTGISRPGHSFTSWNTLPNGTGISYQPGELTEITGDLILYAQWEVSDFFSVSYEPNGGMGSHADTNIPYGSDYRILTPEETGISRMGYRFIVWNTSPDGNGTFYFPEQIINLTEDLVLYAQWEASELFAVTYESNSGIGGHVDAGLTYGSLYTILSSAETGISRAGHTFTGWNTLPGGEGTSYQPGQIIEITSDLTLYAQWEISDFFSVTYEPNGGMGGHVDTNLPYGSEYAILSPAETGISRAGHAFTGWNTLPGGEGTSYQPGQIIEITSDLTLYAQWEISDFFSVTYEPNGGMGGHVDTNLPYGSEYVILSSVETGISCAGHTFTGWNTLPGGEGTSYQPGQIIGITSDLILYAQWEASEFFTVTYEPNSGTGRRVDAGLSYGALYTILSPAEAGISRAGYAFIEWNTSPIAPSAQQSFSTSYQPGGIIVITENLTLFARWRLIEQPSFTPSCRTTGCPLFSPGLRCNMCLKRQNSVCRMNPGSLFRRASIKIRSK